jgi:soluble lytic murein transglycosylase
MGPSMICVLFLVLAAGMRVLDPHAASDAPAGGRAAAEQRALSAGLPVEEIRAPNVPEPALVAFREGRFFRASLLLRDHMRSSGDSTPETVLLAARSAVGWGDWDSAERLLAGRAWLDRFPLAWAVLGEARVAQQRWAEARAALDRALAGDGLEGRERALARARLGHAHKELGDDRAAAAAYEQAADALPALRDWFGLFAALASGRTGDGAGVERRLAGIDREIAREWGWQASVDARLVARDTAGAIVAAESAAPAITGAARRADAWRQAGTLRAARGDHAGARTAFRNAINASAGSAAARISARALAEQASLADEDQLLVGRTLLRHGDHARGSALLRSYIDGGSGTVAAREALRLELGTALFNARQFRDSERELNALARATSDRGRAAQALFVASRSQYRDGRQGEGRAGFERVGARYAGEAGAVQALYFAADLLQDDGELARAERLYRQVVDSGRSDVEEVGLAAMRLGGLAWVRGDHAAALREFNAYRTRFPSGRVVNQATYWEARALAQLGDEAAARRLMQQVRQGDPLGYYGALASEYLGAPFPGITLAAGPAPTRHAAVAMQVERIDLLRAVGWDHAVGFEIERLRARNASDPGTLYALAEALNERGLTGAGISIGWDLQRRGGWNDRVIRIIYPFPYRQLILAEAAQRGVDPFLAAGLIRQESMFNASAISPAGAVGLMQVMPETGSAVARGLGIDRFTPDMLSRAEVNAYIGMAYLADQIRTYGDRTDAVLAAYNAGPHRVERWRTLPEWPDRPLFAERIPFAETRGYVKIVQSNMHLYRHLYRDAAPAAAGSAGALRGER